jgi:hypothetical protein
MIRTRSARSMCTTNSKRANREDPRATNRSGVHRVSNHHTVEVEENGCRLLEGDTVLLEVALRFLRNPFEITEGDRRHTIGIACDDGRCASFASCVGWSAYGACRCSRDSRYRFALLEGVSPWRGLRSKPATPKVESPSSCSTARSPSNALRPPDSTPEPVKSTSRPARIAKLPSAALGLHTSPFINPGLASPGSARVGAADKWRRIEAIQRLVVFLKEYAECWRRWKAGNRTVVFPHGTYAMRVYHGVTCAQAPPAPA